MDTSAGHLIIRCFYSCVTKFPQPVMYIRMMRPSLLAFCVLACSTPRGDVVLTKGPSPSVAPSSTEIGAKPATDEAREPFRLSEGTPPPRMACLRAGYQNAIDRVEQMGKSWFVVLVDGTRLAWDDGRIKSFETRLGAPDLEDQLSIPYPAGEMITLPEENDDPGRFRVEALFKAVYGATEKRVRDNLTTVVWLPKRLGRRLRFNRENGAAEALTKVSRALDDRLPKSALRYISQPAGTFAWRHIAGTNRLSAHSFGIAVDINVDASNYWRWEMNKKPLVYRNRVPYQIVEVFEKHGFIWGGKWYHYDTMHFEYRPELFADGCLR